MRMRRRYKTHFWSSNKYNKIQHFGYILTLDWLCDGLANTAGYYIYHQMCVCWQIFYFIDVFINLLDWYEIWNGAQAVHNLNIPLRIVFYASINRASERWRKRRSTSLWQTASNQPLSIGESITPIRMTAHRPIRMRVGGAQLLAKLLGTKCRPGQRWSWGKTPHVKNCQKGQKVQTAERHYIKIKSSNAKYDPGRESEWNASL